MSGMRRAFVASCVVLALILVTAGSGFPEIPYKVNYQGKLTEGETGSPLAGSYSMTFRIYDDPSAGSLLWSEARTLSVDSSGVFSTILGSSAPIDLSFDYPVWLEVEVEGEVLWPRREIVSVPFAFRAETADRVDHATDADMVDGLHADAFADSAHVHTGYLMEGEMGSVTGEMIADGEITDDDIAPGAGIDPTKVSGGAWTSTNDGTGSGLDADMVDGLHADAFSETTHDHNELYFTKGYLQTPGSVNSPENPVDWSKLKGVPGGFADGIDDIGSASGDGHSLDASDGDPTDALFVDTEGRVGVGTPAPQSNLHVSSPISNFGMVRLENSNSGDNEATIGFREGSDAGGADIWVAGVGAWGNTNDFVIGRGAEKLLITPTGNLGIGTTNPTNVLELSRSGGWCWGTATDDRPDGIAGWAMSNQDQGWELDVRGPQGDAFVVVDMNRVEYRLAIDTQGDVGVGTTDPAAKFHVVGDRIRLEEAGGAKHLDFRTDGAELDIEASNGSLFLKSTTDYTIIQGFSGYVGIGTTGPGYELQVGDPGEGTTIASNNWHTMSSRDYKTNIRPLGASDYKEMLEDLSKTDVYRYRFRDDANEVEHIGLIAEEAPAEIVSSDGKGLSLADYSAFLLAAIKAQQEQIEDLQSQVNALRAELHSR